MPIVTIGGPPPPVLPERVRLTLGELAVVADAVGARLPFETPEPTEGTTVTRLGQRLARDGVPPEAAARGLLDEQLDPGRRDQHVASLAARGLVADGAPVESLAAAVRALGDAELLITADLATRQASLRSWLAVRGDGLGQLATADGGTWELGRYPLAALPAVLERTASVELPEEEVAVELPDPLRLPYELLLAGVEAVRRDREDLLAELVRQHSGQVRAGSVSLGGGEVVDDGVAREYVRALEVQGRGRLRITVSAPGSRLGGLTSFLLLSDGWRWLEPRTEATPAVAIHRVDAGDVGRVVAPVVAEVLAGVRS
jgi:hypothetical protein